MIYPIECQTHAINTTYIKKLLSCLISLQYIYIYVYIYIYIYIYIYVCIYIYLSVFVCVCSHNLSVSIGYDTRSISKRRLSGFN